MKQNPSGYTIWSVVSCRCPYCENMFAVNFSDFYTGNIRWFYFCVIPDHIFLYLIYLVQRYSLDRSFGNARFILFYTNQNVSASDILKIIGKGTYRPIDI